MVVSPEPRSIRAAQASATNFKERVSTVNAHRRSWIPYGGRFQAARRHERWRTGFGRIVLRRKVQIARATLGNFPENRTTHLSPVIAFLGIVHHHGDANLGIVRREKPDERGKILSRLVTA